MEPTRLENKFNNQLHLQKAFKNKCNSYYKTKKKKTALNKTNYNHSFWLYNWYTRNVVYK